MEVLIHPASLQVSWRAESAEGAGRLGDHLPRFYSFLCTPTLLWVKEIWERASVVWIHEYVRVYVVSVKTHGYVLYESRR